MAWELSPLLNVLHDEVRRTSAKGYFVLSTAYTVQRAPLLPAPAPQQLVSLASNGSAQASAEAAPQAVLLTPLAAAVLLEFKLPLNPMLATTRMLPIKTILDLFSSIAGLMGLLGAFGVGAAALQFLQSKLLGASWLKAFQRAPPENELPRVAQARVAPADAAAAAAAPAPVQAPPLAAAVAAAATYAAPHPVSRPPRAL